jgi:hypothetical protein
MRPRDGSDRLPATVEALPLTLVFKLASIQWPFRTNAAVNPSLRHNICNLSLPHVIPTLIPLSGRDHREQRSQ